MQGGFGGYSRDRAVRKRDEVGACRFSRNSLFRYFPQLGITQDVPEISILAEADLVDS